jgi:hypothetical protein
MLLTVTSTSLNAIRRYLGEFVHITCDVPARGAEPATVRAGRFGGRARTAAGVLAGSGLLAGGLVLLLAQAGVAQAASAPGTTQANVDVSSGITLSNLTPSFTLTGGPGTTVTQDAAVTMTVQTNNSTGYQVTVQAAAPSLAGTGVDTIPVTNMSARETGDTDFGTVSNLYALHLYDQDTPSAPTGDQLSNDYEINIPDVAPDTYSVTLDYVAASQ